MKSRRAQAAMEFLMSYGWAILVVLVVIGALAYFDVLSPQKLLPDKCTFPPGLVCEDYAVSSGVDGVQLVLSNGLGKSITITEMAIIDSASGLPLGTACSFTMTVNNGQRTPTPLKCGALDPADAGTKKKLDIRVKYVFAGAALSHTVEGEIYATVQP